MGSEGLVRVKVGRLEVIVEGLKEFSVVGIVVGNEEESRLGIEV